MKTSAILISILLILMSSFTLINEWKVPIGASKIKNPTNINDSDGNIYAKSLWSKYCKSCHGKFGNGDGTKSSELDTEIKDFFEVGFQSQTDGDIFYKIRKENTQ